MCVGEEDFPGYRDVSCLVERKICKFKLEAGTKESGRVLGWELVYLGAKLSVDLALELPLDRRES